MDFSHWWLRYPLRITLILMSLDFTNDQSTLVQVMAWCRQATTITWANVDPDICRYMVSLGYNELIHQYIQFPYNIHNYVICIILMITL